MRRYLVLGCAGVLLLAGVATAAMQAMSFNPVTAQRGILRSHEIFEEMPIGTGAAWFDFDNDGDLDLYVTNRTTGNYLWENDGTGNFNNVSTALGVADFSGDGSGVSVADIDNDGDDDLFLANSGTHILFRNDLDLGSPGFTDITVSAGLQNFGGARGTTASWGDYDNDGFVDLYVAHHMNPAAANNTDFTHDTSDRLYHNEGNGTFTDVTSMLEGTPDGDGNTDVDGFGFVAGFTDFDNDGDLDIHLMNDCPFGPKGNKLWRNDGGSFAEVSALVGADICQNAMGLGNGDYNRDGWRDYYFSNITSGTLLENVGGSFNDATVAAGVYEDFVPGTGNNRITWGSVFLDYNLDGFEDLVVASGAMMDPVADPQPNFLYSNNGDGTFANVSTTEWVEDPNKTRTVIRGDYDGDGDPDLFWSNFGGPSRLMENTASGPGARWLVIELNGQGAGMTNANGIGARIEVTSDGVGTQFFEMVSGSSLGGGDHTATYVGLDSDDGAEILVAWPSGFFQIIPNQMANRHIEIDELTYSGQSQKIIDDLNASTVHPNIVGNVVPHLEAAIARFDDDMIPAARTELRRASRKMQLGVQLGLISQVNADLWSDEIWAVINAAQMSQ